MFRLVLFFLTVSIFALGGSWLLANDGNIIITWLGYEVEAPMSYLLVAVALLSFGIAFVVYVLSAILRLPATLRYGRQRKKDFRIVDAITKAHIAIESGDIKQLKRYSKSLNRDLKNTALPSLLSLEKARMENNREDIEASLMKLQNWPETKFVAVKGMLSLAKQDNNTGVAHALAKQAYLMRPDIPGTAADLLQAYKQQGKFSDSLMLLDKVSAKKSFLPWKKDSNTCRDKAVLYMMQSKNILRQGEGKKAIEYAESAFAESTTFPPVAAHYATLLINDDRKRKASSVIEKTWKTSPDPELAEIYLSIFSSDVPAKKHKRAKKLLAINGGHYESHMVVARTAIGIEDYDLARNHIKSALAISETRDGYSLMVRVEKEGGMESALMDEWQEMAKDHSSLGWVCQKCNHLAPKWHFFCEECSSADSFVWGSNVLSASKENFGIKLLSE